MFPTAHGVVSQGGNGAPSSGLWTDFSEYALGDPPGDWTWTVASGNTVSIEAVVGAPPAGRVMRITRTSNGTRLFLWDEVAQHLDNHANVEILALVRQLTNAVEWGGICVRQDSTTAYAIRNTSTQHCATRVTGGLVSSYVDLGSAFGSHAADTWYWMRFRANGTTISAKTWAHGTAEPGAWGATETDSNLTTAGGAGIAMRRYNNNVSIEIGWFSFAFNGATAPSP